MSSRIEQRRDKKRTDRRKRLERERNERHNQPEMRFRLDVMFDGGWKSAKGFRSESEWRKHVDDVEALRKRGDTEIIRGKVIEIHSGRCVAEVAPYTPAEVGPGMSEAAKTPKGSLVGVNVDISEKS